MNHPPSALYYLPWPPRGKGQDPPIGIGGYIAATLPIRSRELHCRRAVLAKLTLDPGLHLTPISPPALDAGMNRAVGGADEVLEDYRAGQRVH